MKIKKSMIGRLLKKIASIFTILTMLLCTLPVGLLCVNAAEPAPLSVNNTTEQTFTIVANTEAKNAYNRISVKGTNIYQDGQINLLSQKNPLMVSIDLVSDGSMEKIKFGTSEGVALTDEYDCSSWKEGESHTVTLVFYPDTSYSDTGVAYGSSYKKRTDLYIDSNAAIKFDKTENQNYAPAATLNFSELRFYNLYKDYTASHYLTVKAMKITNQFSGNPEKPASNNLFSISGDKVFSYTRALVSTLKNSYEGASVFAADGSAVSDDTELTDGMKVKFTKTYDTVSLSGEYTYSGRLLSDISSSNMAETKMTYAWTNNSGGYMTRITSNNTALNLLNQKNPVAVSMKLKSNGKMKNIYFGTSQSMGISKNYDCSAWKENEIHTVTLVFYPDTNFVDPGTSAGADYTFKSDLYIDNKPALSDSATRSMTGKNAIYKLDELRLYHLYNDGTADADRYVMANEINVTNKIDGAVEKPSFHTGDSFHLNNNYIFGYTGKTADDLKKLNENASVFQNDAEVTVSTPLAAGMIVKLTNTYDTVSLSSLYTLADNDSGIFVEKLQGYSNGYPSEKFTEGTFTVKTSVYSSGETTQLTGYLAQYDSDGNLINVGMSRTVTVESDSSASLETNIDIEKTAGTTLKFMLWDNDMKPYITSISFDPYSASELNVVKTYPNYATKAATFSFDDGIVQDIALIETLDKFGAKATFNLVGENLTSNFAKYGSSESQIYDYVKNLYKNHEIGNHTYKHTPAHLEDGQTSQDSHGTPLIGVSAEKLAEDINTNQTFLKDSLGATTRGIAWPNGLPFERSDYSALESEITKTGHVYSRDTTDVASFNLPTNWMRWNTNGHLSKMTYQTEQFLKTPSTDGLKLLYIWGHAYEFGTASVGTLSNFEENLSKLKNANVWFATNGEVYDYANAMNKLSILDNTVKNLSDQTLYLYVNGKKVALAPDESYSPAPLTIVCWGDSLTYGQGATNEASGVNAYPGVLASKIPDAAVYNLGIGGETALSIAARQGVVAFTANDDFTIPASGAVKIPLASVGKEVTVNSEKITKTFYYFPTEKGGYIVPRSNTAGRWNPVTIAGIEGTLACNVSYEVWPRLLTEATFTRTTPGDPVHVSKDDKFITGASQVNKIADVNVFFTGTNGGWSHDNTSSNPDDLIALLDSQIASTKNKEQYIVIGLTEGKAEKYKELNEKLTQKYGQHFIDAKAYFTSEEALADAGLTSLTYAPDGTAIPTEFLCTTDTVHFNDLGYRLLANLVYEKLNELGYLK